METTLAAAIFQQPLKSSHWIILHRTSSVQLQVRQRNLLGGSPRIIDGKFEEYSGFIETSKEDFSGAEIRFSVMTNTIDTGNKRRDKHLASDAFLNSEQFPVIRFYSVSFEKKDDDKYILEGDCIIRGVAKTVLFEVTYRGIKKDEAGNAIACFKASAEINRRDFGIRSNLFFEALVEKKIRMLLDLEFFQLT